MAIGKLLPRTAPPPRRYRVAADRTFAVRSLATSADRVTPPIGLDFLGLVTPPQPFAEAERKASLNRAEHSTVPRKLTTAQSHFSLKAKDSLKTRLPESQTP